MSAVKNYYRDMSSKSREEKGREKMSNKAGADKSLIKEDLSNSQDFEDLFKDADGSEEDSGNFSGADIETGADTLLSFLEEKTKFPVSEIADDLGVPEKTVKIWAKALEKSGYIKITYSAIKGMVLEYDSDKSYEELNVGRSELPTNLDEIEVEVEEEEIIEEDRQVKKTGHRECEEPAGKDLEDDGGDRSVASRESSNRNSDKAEKGVEGSGAGRGSDTPGAKSSSVEEGKEKLKDELEKLDREKSSTDSGNEEDKKKATLNAKKAKIKKSAQKVKESAGIEGNEPSGKAGDQTHDMGSSPTGRSSTGLSSSEVSGRIENRVERLLSLGDDLKNPEKDNHETYSSIEDELELLKNYILENEVNDSEKQAISAVMERLEADLDNAAEDGADIRQVLENLLQRFKEFWEKHKPIEKVDEE